MNKSEGKIKYIFAPLPIKQHSVGCLFIFIPVLSYEYITQIYINPRNGNRIYMSVRGDNKISNVLLR
jgi:hypothetical protein